MVTSQNQLLTGEEFIEKVATISAFTSIAYQIRCTGEPPIAVSDWLREELRHFRQYVSMSDQNASRRLCVTRRIR